MQISEVWELSCVWLFYQFYFERNYDILKSKNPGILMHRIIKFNKNETGLKMGNLIHCLRETSIAN